MHVRFTLQVSVCVLSACGSTTQLEPGTYDIPGFDWTGDCPDGAETQIEDGLVAVSFSSGRTWMSWRKGPATWYCPTYGDEFRCDVLDGVERTYEPGPVVTTIEVEGDLDGPVIYGRAVKTMRCTGEGCSVDGTEGGATSCTTGARFQAWPRAYDTGWYGDSGGPRDSGGTDIP